MIVVCCQDGMTDVMRTGAEDHKFNLNEYITIQIEIKLYYCHAYYVRRKKDKNSRKNCLVTLQISYVNI